VSKRYKDKKHLEWVASLPCILCQAGFYTHSREVQAHHLLKPYKGARGMSLRSGDDNVIPLCFHHHSQLHTKFGDEYKFFEHYGLSKDFGKIWAKRLFEKRSFQEQSDDELPF